MLIKKWRNAFFWLSERLSPRPWYSTTQPKKNAKNAHFRFDFNGLYKSMYIGITNQCILGISYDRNHSYSYQHHQLKRSTFFFRFYSTFFFIVMGYFVSIFCISAHIHFMFHLNLFTEYTQKLCSISLFFYILVR